jgi:hypothetical protein
MEVHMKLNKKVTSRNGNDYNVNINIDDNSGIIRVNNENGEQLFIGSIGTNTTNDNNHLINCIKDIILYIEEKYPNYGDLVSFENWDGNIS